MVMRRSDIKRISKDVSDTLEDNPKRTKVHAQRKFAQGSGMNSPVMTPIKDKEKSKVNGTSSSPELLPSKRPRTEDFLTYLCFRGTEALPPRLDFFNLASKSDKSEKDSSTPGSSKQTVTSQQENKIKRVKSKLKNPKIVHSLKNKIHENRLNTRSSRLTPQTTPLHLRHRQVEDRQKKVVNVTKKQLVRGRPAHHPSILKRLGATRLRTGLRSGGQLPPGSDVGIKSDRKPRKKLLRTKSSKNKKEEKARKNISKGRTNNMTRSRNESENEDEEDQEEQSVDEDDSEEEESDRNDKQKGEVTDEKKEKEAEVEDTTSKESRTTDEPAAKKTCRISTRSRASSGSPANPPTSLSVSTRPSRKTKEVATLYMEMLTKDLRSPEEEEEEVFVKMPSETGSVTKKSDNSVGTSNFKKHRKGKNNETIKNKTETSNKISLRTRASRRGRMKLRDSDKFNREDFRVTRGQSGARQWTRGRPPLRRGRGRPPLTRITSERRILRNVGKFTNFAEDQSETEDEEDEMYVKSLLAEEMESSSAKPVRSTAVGKNTKTATKNETQNEQNNHNDEKPVNKRRARSLLNSKVQKSVDDSSEEETRRHTRGSKVKEQITKVRKRSLPTRRTRLDNSDSEIEKKSDSGKDKNPVKRGRKDSIEKSKDVSEKDSSKVLMKAESSNSGRKKGLQEKKDAEDSALKVQSNQTDQSVAYLLLSLAQMQGWTESEADSHCVEENSSATRSTRSSVKEGVKEETKNKRGRKSNTAVDSRATNEKVEEEKSNTNTAKKNKVESLTPETTKNKSKVSKSNSSNILDSGSDDEKNCSAIKGSKSGNIVEKKVSRRESFSNRSKNQDIKTSSDSDEEKSTLGKKISDDGTNSFSKKSSKPKIVNRGSELSSESEVDVKVKNETKSKDGSEIKKDIRGKRKPLVFKKEEESFDGKEIDVPETKNLLNTKKNGNSTNFETCTNTKSVVTEAMKGNFMKASQKIDDDVFCSDLVEVESVKKVESETSICRPHNKDSNIVGSEKKRKPVTTRKSSADSYASQSSTVNCKVLVEPIVETVGTFMKKPNEKCKNIKGKGISEKVEDNFVSSDENEATQLEKKKTSVKTEICPKTKKLTSPNELISHKQEYDLSGSEKSQNDVNIEKKIIDEEITSSDESDSGLRLNNKAGKEFRENKDATNLHKRVPRRARIDYSQGNNRDVHKRTSNTRILKSVSDKYIDEDSYSSDVSSTSEEMHITAVKSQKRIKPKNAAQNDAIESALREAQNAILKQENNESDRDNSSLPPSAESRDNENSVNLTPPALEVKFKNETINDHARQRIDFKNFPQLPTSKTSENKSNESSGSTQGKERALDKSIVQNSLIIERCLDNSFTVSKTTSVKDNNKSLKLDEVSQNTSTVFKMNPSNLICDNSVKQINVENENKKQSMSETWRQAFKNAKIPKPGQSSPVPHGVKPFVRKPFTSTSMATKQSEVIKGSVNQNISKITSSLNQFKSSAFQSLGKYSPNRAFSSGEDVTKSQSPSRRVIEIRDSPSKSSVSSSEESRIPPMDTKKIEQPAKSLTQLQYEKRSSDLISSLKDAPIIIDPSYTVAPFTSKLKEAVSEAIPQRTSKTAASNIKPAEGKHLNLPLAVEHTLRKMSPITVSKKPLLTKNTAHLDKKVSSNISAEKHKEVDEIKDDSIKSGSQIEETTAPRTSNIEILGKKKVNMTTEEIKRWLDDSTSSGIEHAKDCGIFEKNQCECSYRTSGASMLVGRGVTIGEAGTDLTVNNREMRVASCQPTCSNKSGGEFKAVEPVELRELAEIASKYGGEILTCKVEDYREKEIKNKEVKNKQRRQSSGFKSDRSMTEEEMCEFDFRFDRNSNSPRESGSEMSSPPPLRDDISEKSDPQHSSPSERKPIFQQRRSCGMPLKRPSQSKSPAAAFSAENESSVYAFEPEDPPVSVLDKPFRRRSSKGTRDEEIASHSAQQTPSSSIAVQVNLESEAVLETEAVLECCTTQTEHSQDDEENGGGGRSFYIPIEQSSNQLTPQQTIKGVTLKVESEGPNNQRVMLRAKLVTKPPSTFATPSTSHRLVETTAENGGNSSGSGSSRRRPEQKVRPLSARAPPVGTVQPTLREAFEQTTITGGSAKLEKPRQASQGTQSSPLPASANSSNLTESSESLRVTKGGKSNVGKVGANPIPEVESSNFSKTTRSGTASMVEAPTFYPTEKEFGDPLEYIEKITPLAQQHGICRIVPPPSFKPECKVSDDMRFTAYNQYIHKMLYRWGPNVREMSAIRKYLATQNIALNQPPWIGGMEVDLPRLYQTVQQCGGLKEVYEKKRWTKVADAMKIPRSSQDRVTKLDDIYCKFLLPYDTLSHSERSKLLEEVEIEWREREKRMLEEDDESDEKEDGSDNESDTDDRDECITKGKSVALSGFYRIARNTMSMWFSKDSTPGSVEVENEFWRHVTSGNAHVCVHSGSIDTATWGCGFPTGKERSSARHPWNLKILTNNPRSILRSLGPVIGVTVPTLHVGMLYSACCWYRDPHALPWIEYLHTGANKIWYGVPDSWSEELKRAVKRLMPRYCRDKKKIWLASDTVMVPPQLLVEHDVSVCRTVQEPGQFVVVFPRAFTSSLCTGYLVSESVYFALASWLDTSRSVFKDIQDSCEPPIFSLEKLLFNVATDIRSSAEVLTQILPMVIELRDEEVSRRKVLEGFGLVADEKLPVTKGRRTKSQEEPNEYECEICRGNLFLSLVTNTQDEINYCLVHAIDVITKDKDVLKQCKLMYAYDEEEMEELIGKIKTKIEIKSQKKGKSCGTSSNSKN